MKVKESRKLGKAGKLVYFFGSGKADGDAGMKNLLGGKGANLAEMASLGLPVPPGFTITTEVCTHYYANGRRYPAALKEQVAAALARRGEDPRPRIRRPEGPAAALGALRRPLLDAGHDGDRPERRPDVGHDPGDDREDRQRPLRLRRLPAPDHDVRRRRHGEGRRSRARRGPGRAHAARAPPGGAQEEPRLHQRHPDLRRRNSRASATGSRSGSAKSSARSSPTMRRPSSGAGSAPFSSPGTASARSPTARSKGFRTTGGRRSPCRPWSSATWATTAPPASRSPATPGPARTPSTASGS